ncbi:histone-lysine N-methyltransferase SETD1B-like [Paramacrobiotus metropolitanus]|uniref:histone-lysine N-methyltransferase SETD1B-like n=1 Tax=Paramacrobiotus metropolitanus TaxID=2943436 RepID=UPI002445EDFE|nr:histone-lysine N-methyltransferase SETD1B-like [Paramacrobiotus metropolitanus]
MAMDIKLRAIFTFISVYLVVIQADVLPNNRSPASWLRTRQFPNESDGDSNSVITKADFELHLNASGWRGADVDANFSRSHPQPDLLISDDDGHLDAVSLTDVSSLQPDGGDDILAHEEDFRFINDTSANSTGGGDFAVSVPTGVVVIKDIPKPNASFSRRNVTANWDDRENMIVTNYNAQERSYSSGEPAPRIYGLTGGYGGHGWGAPTFRLPRPPLAPLPPIAPMMVMRPPPPPPMPPIIPIRPPPMPPMMMMPPPPIPMVPGVPAVPSIIMPPVPYPPPVPAFSFPSYGSGWGYR